VRTPEGPDVDEPGYGDNLGGCRDRGRPSQGAARRTYLDLAGAVDLAVLELDDPLPDEPLEPEPLELELLELELPEPEPELELPEPLEAEEEVEDEPESPDFAVEPADSLAGVLPESVEAEDSDLSPPLTALTAPARESVR
jgi:hypothetical protein